jgi:hypothetical protein
MNVKIFLGSQQASAVMLKKDKVCGTSDMQHGTWAQVPSDHVSI